MMAMVVMAVVVVMVVTPDVMITIMRIMILILPNVLAALVSLMAVKALVISIHLQVLMVSQSYLPTPIMMLLLLALKLLVYHLTTISGTMSQVMLLPLSRLHRLCLIHRCHALAPVDLSNLLNS